MATENEEVVVDTTEEEVEESLDLPKVEEGEEDTTDYKAEALKLRDKAIAQRERTKALRKELSDTKKAVEIAAGLKKEPTPVKTSELDENALDFLDLKGITEDEDVTLIENIIAKTGQTVREALKDEYVVSKLKTNKDAREVKAATPEHTKRGGAQGDTLEIAMAKYESTGEYPEDFDLKSKVVNALEAKSGFSVPSYRKAPRKII